MLIKVTDQCTMMCPHCMDAATPTGSMMNFSTFMEAIAFGIYIGERHFILSGGEPTENENLIDFCRWFDNANVDDFGFSIVSNGMWLKDERKCKEVEEITNMRSFVAMQVFTHKKWYKEYDYVVSHKEEYGKYNHVIVDIDDTIHMQDLGRARTNEDAQKEVELNPYFMSCLNASLMAHQSNDPLDFGVFMTLKKMFCKPSVDSLGTVRMSESRFCPAVGNVNDDLFSDIWERMRVFKPCGNCRQYNKFIQSERPDIMMAKKVLGL